ncbi:MAG: hypothetical protein FJW20_20680 [Acidimicrobiia bacterium]|nr:hypothetical protein [Acidimicrobiia bacterium]
MTSRSLWKSLSTRYWFQQRIPVPAITDQAGGDTYLSGALDVGPGRYHVDWLMRDRSGRVCSAYWDMEAELSGNDEQMALAIRPSRAEAMWVEQFQEEPPVTRDNAVPLHVKLLINYAPQDDSASAMQPLDKGPLVAVLRGLARDPRIGKFSIVAFNLRKQKVLYRRDAVPRIDFPERGAGLEQVNVGTVSLGALEKHAETTFLEDIVQEEIGGAPRQDAVIFVGPKAMLDNNVSKDALRLIQEPGFPVLFLNYNLHPHRNRWRGAISRITPRKQTPQVTGGAA